MAQDPFADIARALDATDVRRICVVKPSALGDIVQTLPLVPVLKQRFPDASLSWVVNRSFADLLADLPGLDEVHLFDRRGPWQGWWRLLRTLRSRRFDLVFDLQGLLRTATMTWATGAPVRIGLETAREGAHLSCTHTLPDTGRLVPAWQRTWRVAELLGAADVPRTTPLGLGPEHRHFAEQELAGLPRPVVAVHPGAQWATKRWPVEKFAVVLNKAVRSFHASVAVVGGPDEARLSQQLGRLLRQLCPSAPLVDLTGRTSLRQLAAVLGSVDVALTNDSGPMHLAAATGTPVVSVFTCTHPVRSGPPGDAHRLVASRVPCAASYRKKCPFRGCRHLACLDELTSDRVWQELAGSLAGRRQVAARAA